MSGHPEIFNPKFSRAYCNRGLACWYKGEYDKAVADGKADFHRFRLDAPRKARSPLVTVKAGFSLQVVVRERRYANLGHLLPMFHIERAVGPGVSALPYG